MTIKVCIAGATGWVGQALVKEILGSNQFTLAGAVSRSAAGQDIGTCLGLQPAGVIVSKSLGDALSQPTDVVVDYTSPGSVKERTLQALGCGVRVVIGTSGLTASDYSEIDETARKNSVGVIAAGNFSITAALAKHFALVAARYLPSWEIIDYAHADKMDAPSGTTRELAEELASIARNRIEIPIAETHGNPQSRGATIAGTQIHSVRLPSFVIAFEILFGLPNERLTIRHDAGPGAMPYVAGTKLAIEKVMTTSGLIRGLDHLLFDNHVGWGDLSQP
jgi:4-hydroxy-tetrahydrodipicolinate reductase